jgi:hypothetical protein
MSGHDKDLMGRVEFGIETEAFIRGPIGAFLVERMHEDGDRAVEELTTVDPTNMGRIVELQYAIRRSHNIENWLGGIIQEGYHAEEQLKEKEI